MGNHSNNLNNVNICKGGEKWKDLLVPFHIKSVVVMQLLQNISHICGTWQLWQHVYQCQYFNVFKALGTTNNHFKFIKKKFPQLKTLNTNISLWPIMVTFIVVYGGRWSLCWIHSKTCNEGSQSLNPIERHLIL